MSHPAQIRFSGYRLTPQGQAQLFLPGRQDGSRVRAEVIRPGSDAVEQVELQRQGNYWRASQSLPLGTAYRFLVDDTVQLDALETVERNGESFNRISPNEAQSPQISTVIADIFADSVKTPEELKRLIAENGGLMPVRNHFNQFPGSGPGLQALMPTLREAGARGILLKPFIGGDNISSHKYWTIDPFILNNTFQGKAEFNRFLKATLNHGMKLFADGAFVNQGLNGAQFMSNLAHGFASPYWDWFIHGEPTDELGPARYPKNAYEKVVLGVLPTALNPETGHRDLDYGRFEFRIVNDPATDNYDERRPTLIELYDPNMETADGQSKQPPHRIVRSEDSVQKYQFPVNVDELQAKREKLARDGGYFSDTARKQLFMEWENFRLTTAALDDSALKWDGNVDVAKMNVKNPDVVDYLDNAVGYWTRYVSNFYTEQVARALREAQKQYPEGQPREWLTAITQRSDAQGAGKSQVLPPVIIPAIEQMSSQEIDQRLANLPACPEQEQGQSFAERVMAEYPLNALELPLMYKAMLSYPPLNNALKEKPLRGPAKWLAAVLEPLSGLSGVGPLFSALRDLLIPPTFEKALARKLDEAIGLMPLPAQDKMRYEKIQSLLTETLAETVLMRVFTGQDPKTATPEALENGFYETMPLKILKADPETAAVFLPGFMKGRLKDIPAIELARMLEKRLEGLELELAVLAEAVLQKRELGLNWRIDAAKDVADMDRVRNAFPEDRAALFQEEAEFIKQFWQRLGGTIRDVFPKSSIIAELTDFEMLSNDEASREVLNDLMGSNTYTAMPNMRYVYSQIHQLINYAQRPDEFGASQIKPSDFVKHSLIPMSQAMPFPALRQLQNLTASHDYSTSSHVLLLNPAIWTMDHVGWRGLQDDLNEVCNELLSKPCFAQARAGLGKDLGGTLDRLKKLAASKEMQAQMPDGVRAFWDKAIRQENNNWAPIPFELKGRLIEALFNAITPKDLGVNPAQFEALQTALHARITEHSEARAMRAVIVNTMMGFDWAPMLQGQDLTLLQAEQLKQRFEASLWRALDKTSAEMGRDFGFKPLDIALDELFKNLDDTWRRGLPAAFNADAFLVDMKTGIYGTVMKPVMQKLLRIFAVQNAIPGNPSVYLPDLFAQGGGEWLNVMFVQGRNLIRVDKLASDPDFQAFLRQAGEIFRTRSQPADMQTPGGGNFETRAHVEALNNGVVVPVPVNDESGILPVVRDNGEEQVIVLINTGKPSDIGMDKVGTAPGYKTIESTQTVVGNYFQDLSPLGMQAGTRYRDVKTGEAFVINEDGWLVRADDPHRGIDIEISRMLVRQNAETPAKMSQVS